LGILTGRLLEETLVPTKRPTGRAKDHEERRAMQKLILDNQKKNESSYHLSEDKGARGLHGRLLSLLQSRRRGKELCLALPSRTPPNEGDEKKKRDEKTLSRKRKTTKEDSTGYYQLGHYILRTD